MRKINPFIYFAIALTLVFVPLMQANTVFASENAEAHAGAAHGSPHINWFDFSAEGSLPLVALLFNFLALVLIVYFILRKPLGQKFRERKENLEKALGEARLAKEKAEKALADARAKMDSMDAEMKRIRKDILEAGEAESARISREAEERAKRMMSDTEALADQEVARMVQAIREEIVEEVMSQAEKIIREKMDNNDHERLANDYLEGMGARPSAPPQPEQ